MGAQHLPGGLFPFEHETVDLLGTQGQGQLLRFRKRGGDPVILHHLGKRGLRCYGTDRLAKGTKRVFLYKKA